MRNAIRRKGKLGMSALVAAGFGAWAGAPAAHGNFAFNVNGFPVADGNSSNGASSAWATVAGSTLAPMSYVSDGTTYDVFVFSAQNLGSGSTAGDKQSVASGSELLALDVIIDSGPPSLFNSSVGALGMDVEQVSGTGSAKSPFIYSVNIDGTVKNNTPSAALEAADGYAEPCYGDIAGGTFVGVGAGTYVNSNLAVTGVQSVGGTQAVFVNAQTTEYTLFNDTEAVTTGTLAQIDPQFENPGPAVHPGVVSPASTSSAGTEDNGTIHSIEVESLSNTGIDKTAPLDTMVGGLPFANVVVPVGTTFTVHGGVGGDTGGTFFFGQVITAGVTTSSSLSISLTGTVPSSSNLIANLTISGHNGLYTPVTTAIPAAAQTTGYSSVTGFNPTNDIEIYGLDATGTGSLATLIANLNTALQISNPGAIAEAPTGSAAPLLAGDNIELQFDAGVVPGSSSPAILAYDLSNYTANGTWTFTSLTVIPEPTSIGALLLGGAGLLGRRRRRRQLALA
jgi:hypothetical protein